MNASIFLTTSILKTLFWGSVLSLSLHTSAASIQTTVDNFNHENNNSLGIPRQYANDTMTGGKTQVEQQIKDGVFYAKGEILPPRGQPGWASTIFLLDAQGLPQDLSDYEGIRLRLKVDAGNISVSANSTEITNFDYHASPVIVRADGKFHDVKIPFDSLKRAWSAQTKLNKQTINSLSIVSFGMQPTKFDLALDEVGFY